jgi:zinc protease
MERFSQLIFDRSSPFYDLSADERIAGIEALTPDALTRFYQERYDPTSMALVVVGDVDAAQVERHVEQLLGDWQGSRQAQADSGSWLNLPRTPLDPSPRREVITMPDKASVDVVLGHAGRLRRTDDDYFAALIANAALGYSTLSSRLGVRVRDQEGLSYGIVSRFLEPTFADGPWIISVTVNPQNVDRAIQSAIEVLKRYVADGMTEQELEDEKSAFIGSFVVGLGTNGGIAAQLLSAELFGFGPKHLDEIPKLIQAVALGQANAAIRKYFHPDQLSIVIAGEYL